jgi:putative endopeptidase
MRINGRASMGENIGDLAGVQIAHDAYLNLLGGKPAPVIDGFTGEQRFFLGYAQIWRLAARDDYLRQQLATDPHSPETARSSVPLRNVQAWYEAFGVKPGDKLYIAPAERVHLW